MHDITVVGAPHEPERRALARLGEACPERADLEIGAPSPRFKVPVRTKSDVASLNGAVVLAAETQERPTSASPPPDPAEAAAAKPPWGRIVMVGASASAGFTESEPLGGPQTPQYRLSSYLDAALLVPHEPVQNLANTMFFIQPEAAGRYQIEQALKTRPTLVVGIDFLFWFLYGEGPADKDRLQRFEKGLKLLETIHCPVVVGDIPDASGAADSVLDADQIPSAEAMSAANRRLKEWAGSRPRVVIVSLSRFMRKAMANQALTIHGHTVPEGETRVLLQSDKLHPTAPGCAVLALAMLDAFQSTRPTDSAVEVRWDPKEVFRLAFKPPSGSAGNPGKQVTPPAPAVK